MTMRICNKAHECPVKDCDHKHPHERECGPAMTCHTSGLLSACVPIVDGKYKTQHRDWCPHCGGRGFHDLVKEHDAEGFALPENVNHLNIE
jgi:hypothetical protein